MLSLAQNSIRWLALAKWLVETPWKRHLFVQLSLVQLSFVQRLCVTIIIVNHELWTHMLVPLDIKMTFRVYGLNRLSSRYIVQWKDTEKTFFHFCKSVEVCAVSRSVHRATSWKAEDIYFSLILSQSGLVITYPRTHHCCSYTYSYNRRQCMISAQPISNFSLLFCLSLYPALLRVSLLYLLSCLQFLSTAFSFGIVVATLQDTLKSLRPQINMYTKEQQPGRKLAQNWRYLDGEYIHPWDFLSALYIVAKVSYYKSFKN